MQFERDDLRAAVSTGLLNEAQAASLLALATERAGKRAALAQDDEPFELFRGFAEIFVAVGLVLLITGIMLFAQVLGGYGAPIFGAALCWGFAHYFTLRRRMNLPSIILVLGYGTGAAVALSLIFAQIDPAWMVSSSRTALYFLLMMGLYALWYRVFRLPFTMLLFGLSGLGLVMALTGSLLPQNFTFTDWTALFDLSTGGGLAIGTLIFGALAFVGGLWFDMRDPHRIGRWAASGFWLHILAAPALVNTFALTARSQDGALGNALLALTVLIVSLLALVIDRRSFLTAAIIYLGTLIALALRGQGGEANMALVILILGAILTFMGTFWTQLRGRLMRALPNFPGKSRLPPYTAA